MYCIDIRTLNELQRISQDMDVGLGRAIELGTNVCIQIIDGFSAGV